MACLDEKIGPVIQVGAKGVATNAVAVLCFELDFLVLCFFL